MSPVTSLRPTAIFIRKKKQCKKTEHLLLTVQLVILVRFCEEPTKKKKTKKNTHREELSGPAVIRSVKSRRFVTNTDLMLAHIFGSLTKTDSRECLAQAGAKSKRLRDMKY